MNPHEFSIINEGKAVSGGRISYQNNWVDDVTLRELEIQNLKPNDRVIFNGITNANNKRVKIKNLGLVT